MCSLWENILLIQCVIILYVNLPLTGTAIAIYRFIRLQRDIEVKDPRA